MGPLWCEQATVSHITLSDLLFTDVLVSLPGAPVGAGEETYMHLCIRTGLIITSLHAENTC